MAKHRLAGSQSLTDTYLLSKNVNKDLIKLCIKYVAINSACYEPDQLTAL